MRFISYAQNFEDVMLWRALKGLKTGFYIDVGAHDPEVDSVTKAFYDRGWCGINIEPAEVPFRRLQEARPKDINLALAVAQAPGRVRFFDIPNTGLSTTDPEIAGRHRAAGHTVTETEVEAETLANVCATYVRDDVHFLKIDVEGGSQGVIEGLDLYQVRPWIILVEATEPMSQVPDFAGWERLITQRSYTFVYYDGLNRFYVANERPAIAAAFDCPPNVFDDFSMSATEAAQQRAQEAEARARQVEQAHSDLQRRHADLQRGFAVQLTRTRAAEERAYERERGIAELESRLMQEAAQTAAFAARLSAREERAYERARAIAELESQLTQEVAQTAAVAARLSAREDELRAVFASRSWRLTKPLRLLGDGFRGRRPTSIAASASGTRRPRPTIFIECTHTYHSDLNTGIQRVVRNVLRNAATVAREYGYEVVPVIVEAERFRFADARRILADKQLGAGGPATNPSPPRPGQRLWRGLLRGLATLLPLPAVREFLYAPPHRPGLARAVRLLIPFHRSSPPPPRVDLPGSLDDYDRYDGSILLLLDSSWTIQVWPGARQFKERGGLILGVVYDLIPITHSHTSVPELTSAFKAWLAEHLQLSDGFVCISRSTAEMLENYIAGLGPAAPERRVPVDYFHLGSELDFINLNDSVRPEIREIFATERHAFLMVGSIEPRKMHAYVLDAFDRFWACGGNAALVIVGRQAWKVEAVLERVAKHPELDRRLFVLRDATDAELDYSYRNASSLVIASEIEGFGLPIVEAFQRGLPVMCSDIPVFREIADGKAVFFSLSDPSELTAALDSFCKRVPPGERQKRVPQSWISWQQSAEQLFAAIMRIARHLRVPMGENRDHA